MLQPKLKVGRVDCPLEREVDSIADSIIRRHATKVAAEGKDYSRCTRVGWDEFLTGEKFYNAHKDGITFWRYSELYTSSVVEWAIDSLASPSSYDDFVARMQKLIDAMHYGLTIMRRVKNADYVEYSDLVELDAPQPRQYELSHGMPPTRLR